MHRSDSINSFAQITGIGSSQRRRDYNKRGIVRWNPYNPTASPIEATYQQLFLFSAYRRIPTFIDANNLRELYDSKKEEITRNQERCNIHENKFVIEFENSIREMINLELRSSPKLPTETQSTERVARDVRLQGARYQLNLGRQHLLCLMESLNQEQRDLIYDIVFRLQNNINLPLHIFIEGCGGSGKSYLINALFSCCNQTLNTELSAGCTDTITVLKVAPTGVAAVNINGATIHSAFRIPVMNTRKGLVTGQETTDRKRLWKLQHFVSLRLIIIDEISAVSDTLLSEIDNVLRHVQNPLLPFGGVSVVVVGDLYQLPPPAGRMICSEDSTCPDLWKLFTRSTLTFNMRQKKDTVFFKVLQELRLGLLSESSRTYLQGLVIDHDTLQRIRSIHPKLSKTNEICFTNDLIMEANLTAINRQCFSNISYSPAEDIILGATPDAEEAIRRRLSALLPPDTAGLMNNLPLIVSFIYFRSN